MGQGLGNEGCVDPGNLCLNNRLAISSSSGEVNRWIAKPQEVAASISISRFDGWRIIAQRYS